MLDLIDAKSVEFTVDAEGNIWLNIDGVCAVRVGKYENVVIEVPIEFPVGNHQTARIRNDADGLFSVDLPQRHVVPPIVKNERRRPVSDRRQSDSSHFAGSDRRFHNRRLLSR